MKKVKHSKFKNTGMLFELLTRQITSDIISERDSIATNLLKKYFNKNSELLKDYGLYKTLSTESYSSDSKPTMLIQAFLKARKKIDHKKLREEKYRLIEEITKNFDTNSFFQTKVQNYKLLASIYKIFEYNELDNPGEITRAKVTIIENMTNEKKDYLNESIPSISNEPKEIRLLSYKILVEKFNSKYEELSTEQKSLLREYISNVSNTNNLNAFVKGEASRIKEILTTKSKNVKDKTLKIKLSEVIGLLDQYQTLKKVDEQHISALMRYYNLVNDL